MTHKKRSEKAGEHVTLVVQDPFCETVINRDETPNTDHSDPVNIFALPEPVLVPPKNPTYWKVRSTSDDRDLMACTNPFPRVFICP